MRRIFVVVVAVVLLLAMTAQALYAEASTAPQAQVTRVGKKVSSPRRHIRLVRHFTPTGQPTPQYVQGVIIPFESALWGVSADAVHNRIGCETGHTFRYDAHNASGADGLGQFLPSTWSRAISVMPRRVEMRYQSSDLVHRRVTLLYSDGSQRVVRGRLVRRQVTVIRRGHLPAWPSSQHGWAAVRGVARALAGRGRVGAGEWDCGT